MITKETMDDYRGRKAFISPSNIKGVRTPKEFLYKLYKKSEHKDYFDIGHAVHTLVLEPEKWAKEVICLKNEYFPDPKRLNKDGSVALTCKANSDYNAQFREMNKGKVILKESYYRLVQEMANSVMSISGAKEVLDRANAYIEHCFYVKYIFHPSGKLKDIVPVSRDEKKCGRYEVLVKTRPDFVHRSRLYDLDVKTCNSVDPAIFASEVAKFEYDIQAAMGLDIVGACLEVPMETFLILAVEKTPPYHANLFDLFNQDILDAKKIYLNRLFILKEAMTTKFFKGYEIYADNDHGLLTLQLPNWYKEKQQYMKF